MSSQQNNNATPPGQSVNWPLIACLCAILPIELVLHDVRTFGVRSIGPRVLGAALLMFIFAHFHPNENGAPLICFMSVTILLSIIAQIIAMVRRRRGVVCHTRYNGRPLLMLLVPLSEATIKRWEPLIVLLSGWLLHHINHPLGSFVVVAAYCMGIKVGLERVGMIERALDTSDALVEQTMVLESVRNVRAR
jgi:hypothetical protein